MSVPWGKRGAFVSPHLGMGQTTLFLLICRGLVRQELALGRLAREAQTPSGSSFFSGKERVQAPSEVARASLSFLLILL